MNEERRKSFNNIPELYDTYRPSYPQALIDRIASVIPEQAHILEIGPGTGIATELMARHGYNILGVEPGDKLIEYASQKLSSYSNIRFINAKFEDYPIEAGAFDLVMSASAFHWIDPEIGYRKSAHVLKDNGYLALFWNMSEPQHDPVYNEIQEVYEVFAPELARKPTDKSLQERIKDREAALANSGYFRDITVIQYPWTQWYDAGSYINYLDTHSNHNLLPLEIKAKFYGGIAEVLSRNGGGVTRYFQTTLYLAIKK